MPESSVNIKLTMSLQQFMTGMDKIERAQRRISSLQSRARREYEYGFTNEERALELSLRRQRMKRQNHSQTVSRINARARRIYEYGFTDEERSMELSLRKQLKAEADAYRKRVQMHAKALRENEAMDKRAEAAALSRQSRLGAARGTVGRGAGQVFAGLRGGLSNMWVTGAGMSQMATGIGMYFPKIAGLMGGVGAFANVASNLASLVITVAQNVARAAASALKFGVNMAMGFGRAVVAVGKFVGRTIMSGLERVWSLLNGIAGAAASAAVKMGLLATAATAAAAWIGKSFADAYSKVEGFLAKMEVAFKDRNVAMAWLGWGQQTAMTTPFDTQEVVDSITRLALYGTQKFGTLTEWFKLTGDMAGAMSRSITDAVEAVVDVIYGGGMERIKEFGINSFELIQKGAKAASGGGVARRTAEEINALVKALKAAMADKFGGGMEKLRNTLHGLSSDIQDIVFIVKASIGSALAPALRILIPYIASLGKAFAAWIVPMAQRAAPVLEKVARKFVEWAEKMRVKVGEWWAKFAPKLAAAWKTMLDRISSYIDSQGGWAGIGKRVRDGAVRIWNALKAAVAWIREVAPRVWQALKSAFEKARAWVDGQGGLSGIWQRVKQFGLEVWNAVQTAVVPALQYLGAWINWAYQHFTKGKGIFEGLSGGVVGGIHKLGAVIQWVANLIPVVVGWVDWLTVKWQQWSAVLGPVIDYLRANFVPTLDMLWQGVVRFGQALGISFGEGNSNAILDFVTTVDGWLRSFAAMLPTIGAGIDAFLVKPFSVLSGIVKTIYFGIKSIIDLMLIGPRFLKDLISGEGVGGAASNAWDRAKGNWQGSYGALKQTVGGVGGTVGAMENFSDSLEAYRSGQTQDQMEWMAGGREYMRDQRTTKMRNQLGLGDASKPTMRVQIVPPQGWTANPASFAF